MPASHSTSPAESTFSDETNEDANDLDGSDGLSLGDFAKPLLKHWKALVIGAVVGLLLAIVVVVILPVNYDVSIEIGPADTSSSSLSAAASGTFSSLARLTGLASGAAANPNLDLLVELMKSERLAERIEAKDHFLRRIFPGKWDAAHNRWKPSTGLIGGTLSVVKEALGRPSHDPDAGTLTDYISRNVSIDIVPLSSFKTITMTSDDQRLAGDFITAIVREADALAREDDVKLARAHVQYLQGQLTEVQTLDHREAITSLLTDEERKVMLTQSDLPYLYKPVDPMRIERSKSAAIIILAAGFFGGLFIGALLVFLRGFSNRRSLRFLRFVDPGASRT